MSLGDLELVVEYDVPMVGDDGFKLMFGFIVDMFVDTSLFTKPTVTFCAIQPHPQKYRACYRYQDKIVEHYSPKNVVTRE